MLTSRATQLATLAAAFTLSSAAYATPEITVTSLSGGVFAVSTTGFPFVDRHTTMLGEDIAVSGSTPTPTTDLSAAGSLRSSVLTNGFSASLRATATTPAESADSVLTEGRAYAFIDFTVSESGPLTLQGTLHSTMDIYGHPRGDSTCELRLGSTTLYSQTGAPGDQLIQFSIPSAAAGTYWLFIFTNGQSISGEPGAPSGTYTGELAINVTTAPAPGPAGLMAAALVVAGRRRRTP